MFLLNKRVLFSAWAVLACTGSLRAAGPGDEVIVVYNRRVPQSKDIAQYYAAQRHVPRSHIFGFDLTTSEDISRAEFRDSLEEPLAKAIADHKLWQLGSRIFRGTNHEPARVQFGVIASKIRYAVLCYGVPLRIQPDPNLKESGSEQLRPELRRNEAAVDSELAVLPLLEDRPRLDGPLPNPLYGTTNAALLSPTNGLLMVTRLDGPSPDIARRLVDKALQAETNGLWGRAYFDLRHTSEPGYKLGDEWIGNAAEAARHFGFETVVEDTPDTFPASFPMSQIALYEGWYHQDACGPFAQAKVEFMPGAFAYHLHSFSACTLRSTNQAWAGPFLAKGATCTMGSVYEPYLAGTPDVSTFTARLLFSGFSFGEAAYAGSSTLSWQTTVVGDPLYRPFRRSPEALQTDLERRHSPLLAWFYLRLLNLNRVAGRPLPECINLLEQLPLTKTNAVLSEKLGDLYAAQGKPSSAVEAYGRALQLDPSPEQRVRLLLTQGDQLLSLGRDPDAYADYQQLLADSLDYPDKAGLYRKLVPLARKLQRSDELKVYEAELARLDSPPPQPDTHK